MERKRRDALNWLAENIESWPVNMDTYISKPMFKGLRFIDTLPEREIVFGNGLMVGITKDEFDAFKSSLVYSS